MESADLRTRVRAARRKFVAMATCYSLGTFNDNFFRQAGLLVAVAVGLQQLQGIALTVFGLPYIFLAAPAGWLADRYPKRNVVIATKALELGAMVLGAVGLVTLFVVPSVGWGLFLAMVFTMGLQSALFNPALNGSIPELYPAEYVATANGILRAVVMVAILSGFVLAGPAVQPEAELVSKVPWGHVIVAAGALAVAAIGFAVSFHVPTRPAAAPTRRFPWTGPVDTFGELVKISRDGPLWVATVGNAVVFGLGAYQISLITLMGPMELGLTKTQTSLLVGAEIVGIALGALLAGRLARGARWRGVLVPALLVLAGVAGGVFAAVQWVQGPLRLVVLAGLLIAAGACGGLVMIACEAFIQIRPHPDQKGAVLAATNCAAFIVLCLAGPLYAAVCVLLRWPGSAGFAVLAVLMAALAVYVGWRLRKAPP